MAIETAWLVPLGGLAVGCVMGFTARRFQASLDRASY